MISFKPYNTDSRNECLISVLSEIPGAERDEMCEIFDYLDDMSVEYEIAVTAFSGCLLVRIFDGEYLFVYPIAMTDTADESRALDELRLYAIKEEIPFVLTDVPRECADTITEQYSRTELCDEDGDGERFTVRFISECNDASDGEVYSFENGLSLTLPTDKYVLEYARLCRDGEVNKYWGYDYRHDVDGCEDAYFLREAESGLGLGCTLTLFVLQGESFVGEALLYYFDYLGGAKCAIRLLPEFMGRGIGTKVMDSLIEVARRIGLKTLYATVDPDNEPSIKLFEKKFKRQADKAKNIKFMLKM